MKKTIFKILALCLAICSMLTVFVGCGGSGAVDDRQTVEFGMYPQTKVEDDVLISALTSKAGSTSSWTDYGYFKKADEETDAVREGCMSYKDVEYDGAKYRGILIRVYRAYTWKDVSKKVNSWQDNSAYYRKEGITFKGTFWFKYEPIKWTVISEEEGYSTLVSTLALDSQAFNDTFFGEAEKNPCYIAEGNQTFANNYESSTIRKWLTETFFDLAFTSAQKAQIQTVSVDNGIATTGYAATDFTEEGYSADKLSTNKTNDKVFLLSYEEAITYFTDSEIRDKQSSDYAKSQGIYSYLSGGSYLNNSCWWLRSPSNKLMAEARYVRIDGEVEQGLVAYNHYGVVPAIKAKLA